MNRRIFFVFVFLSTVATLAYATEKKPIDSVELALFYQRFACTEHVNGELNDLGDALGSDCLVLGGMGAPNGVMRFYKTNGATNEDWYGWHAEVHAPFDGIAIEVGVNNTTNAPGRLGQPPPSYIKFERADGVVVVYAHLDNIRVRQGDHVGVGQVVALDGNNGTAKNPHVHVGAYRDKAPLQIRWDLTAEGRIQSLAHQTRGFRTTLSRSFVLHGDCGLHRRRDPKLDFRRKRQLQQEGITQLRQFNRFSRAPMELILSRVRFDSSTAFMRAAGKAVVA